jgi:hypothetical protein
MVENVKTVLWASTPESIPSFKFRTCRNMLMKSKKCSECFMDVIFDLLHQEKNFNLEHEEFHEAGRNRRRKLCVTICTLPFILAV